MTKQITLMSKRTWVNKHMHVDNSKLIHCKYVNDIINIRKTIISNTSLVKYNFKNEISTCIFIWTFSFYFLFHSLLIFGNYCARYDSSIPCQVNVINVINYTSLYTPKSEFSHTILRCQSPHRSVEQERAMPAVSEPASTPTQ